MQKSTALAILAICLTSFICLASDLPASGQGNDRTSNTVAPAPGFANGKIGINQDYKLTVKDIQKLYKQSTDGMTSSNITQNPATIMYSTGPVVPLSSLHLSPNAQKMLSTGVPTKGLPLTDTAFKAQLLQAQQQLLSQISDPVRNIPRELAQTLATQTMLGNSAAQVATAQANTAINYAGRYLINFTANEGNVWNRLRDNIFVPIAILLLVPGAVLTQTKAMMAAGNPVIETANPFEGILRAIIAMCFIPGSYLVVNYGIDFSNSISHTIQDAYRSQFGGDMYADAFMAEQRAFPSRQAAENMNGLSGIFLGATPIGGNQVSGFAQLENDLIKNKSFNADGTQVATTGLLDEVLPASAVSARMAIFGTNMLVTSVWGILCAFQLIYLHYLFLVGPIMAAIWVYPIKQLREAWPNWIAGTITLCFWSLFWNTAILLMALFKDADSTGTFIMTALNLLATGSVKYAFDFVGLVSEAGQEAAKIARTGKNEQGGNAAAPASTTTEKKTLSENTKEHSGGGGLLGGITKIATSSLINAAVPGGGLGLSLGSQLLGGALGGSKDGGSSSGLGGALGGLGGLGDLTKGLGMPPLTSSIVGAAFPPAAALGVAGAMGVLGKDEISMPPLAGAIGGPLGAIVGAAESAIEGDAVSHKKSGGIGGLLGGIEEVVDGVEKITGSVGSQNSLGSLTAAAGITGLAGLAVSAAAEGGLEAHTGASGAGKSQAPAVAKGLPGVFGAGRASGGSTIGAQSAAMRAAAAGSAFADGGANSYGDVKRLLHNLAHATGTHETPASVFASECAGSESATGLEHTAVKLDVDDADFNFAPKGALAIAASMSQVGLPPAARSISHPASHTNSHSNSMNNTQTSARVHGGSQSAATNNLFKESTDNLETSSARDLVLAANCASNVANLLREQSECDDADMVSIPVSKLNFASAPPLAFSITQSYTSPPPVAASFAKEIAEDSNYFEFSNGFSSGPAGSAFNATAGSASSPETFRFDYTEAASADYFKAAQQSTESAVSTDSTSSQNPDNNIFFAAAASIDYTVSSLPPAQSTSNSQIDYRNEIESNSHTDARLENNVNIASNHTSNYERQATSEQYVTQKIEPNQNHVKRLRPDQNESTADALNLSVNQPQAAYRRPKSLQELLKPAAFERPCDNCKNMTCHCVITTPPVVGVWS